MVALALVAAVGMVLVNAASPKITLRVGWATTNSASDPYALTARYLAEELGRLAPDRFDVKFFPSSQLGNDAEMLQAMQLGTMDAGVISSAQVGAIVPAFQINDLPFLYSGRDHARRVLDGQLGQELFARLETKQLIGLGFAEAGFRHVINNVRPIHTPQDLQGLRLRIQPSELFLDTFRTLGANPVPIPWNDAFAAVTQRVVAGMEIPLAVIYANGYQKVTQYLSLTSHSYSALALIVSERTFKRLSKQDQITVRHAADRAIQRQRQAVAANEIRVLELLKTAGMQINLVENKEAFRQRLASVYITYRRIIGADLVDQALDAGTPRRRAAHP
jgi:tripartite ATP-independent transporter DctP family solute receptor